MCCLHAQFFAGLAAKYLECALHILRCTIALLRQENVYYTLRSGPHSLKHTDVRLLLWLLQARVPAAHVAKFATAGEH